MPQTEAKNNKPCNKNGLSSIEKEAFNPFPEIYESNYRDYKSKKLYPKIPKKAGKCFQLVLICQKLLKPFSSSHKNCESGNKKINNHLKEKSKSTPQINMDDRLKVHREITPIKKVDVSIQTNIQLFSEVNLNTISKTIDLPMENDYFLKNNEIQTEDYWDLDIDSAIVGDYNSVSEISFDEQIDPHYATIKMMNDGKSIRNFDYSAELSIFNTPLIDRSNSNASSPKSGVYSKINKSKPKDEPLKFKLPLHNYLVSKSNTKLNFDQIMTIKNQLGISREMYAFDDDAKLNFPSNEFNYLYPSFLDASETPDLPKRNYGSSVINFIAKLREEKEVNQSSKYLPTRKSSLITNSDDISRINNNLYSPIWFMKNKINEKILHHEDSPASVPTMPRRSSKPMMFDNLNPVFKDDSSEDASSVSFYSPLKNKYSYPRNFSENYIMKPYGEHQYDNIDRGILVDEIRKFRHMDSEVDISLSNNNGNNNIDFCVPSDLKRSDMCFALEDKLFLEPLMERSYEEDFFIRDITSSLEYINV